MLFLGILLSSLSCKSEKTELIGINTTSIYRMLNGKDSLGYSSIKVKENNNKFILTEITEIPSFKEEITVFFKEDLVADSVRVTGDYSTYKIDCFSAFTKEGSIKGYAGFPVLPNKEMVKIDTLINDKKIIERTLSLFLYTLNLDKTVNSDTAYQYNATDGKISKVQAVWIDGYENVTVPAGDFKCRKLEVIGGVAEQVFYISEENNKIIKIEIKNQPWVYELI